MKNANGLTIIGIFFAVWLLPISSSFALDHSAYQPFATRDQNILNLIHGQALPTNAALLDEKERQWSTSLVITNTLNTEPHAGESIFLDYENYRLNLSYQYGLNKNWNLKFDLPIIYQSGGIFDSSINRWHDFFGLPDANRPFVENNQYNINYTSQGQTLINLDRTNASLGDLQLAAAHKLIETESTTMSVWASLKLPTGDKNKLAGNGATDISAWLALNQKLSDSWLLNVNTGVVALGKNNYQNIPLASHAVYGHVMLGWLITDSINLKLQLQGHTSYFDNSQIKILGTTYFLTFGGTIKINTCNQLDVAMSEDIKVGASPDASLLISWRNFPSRC